jgi:ribose-phosphate pyrophosphokinase
MNMQKGEETIIGIGFDVMKFNFPTGEMQVTVKLKEKIEIADMIFEFKKNEDIIELLLTCDALKRQRVSLDTLYMAYVPFSRQDRAANIGESLSLKVFCDLINGLGFQKVVICDPHSDVTPALLNNCVVKPQWLGFNSIFEDKKDFYLISPDGGALKKIYKLAAKVDCKEVLEFGKARDTKTGEITATTFPHRDLAGADCYIIDDICDGGKTFTEIAKILKTQGVGKIILCVTHGFFTKGLGVFDGLIDEIHTMKGQVK